MKLHTFLLLAVLAAIAAFAAMNWNVFISSTEVSLGVARVQMPLGLVMLGLLVFLTALFFIFAIYMQTSTLLDSRRHSRELQANRELADKAEASRFTELHRFLEAELLKQANLRGELKSETFARLEKLEQDLRVLIEQSGNSLAAYIGELEDRIERTAPPSAVG